jgi:hypothetical protein
MPPSVLATPSTISAFAGLQRCLQMRHSAAPVFYVFKPPILKVSNLDFVSFASLWEFTAAFLWEFVVVISRKDP